MVQATIGYWKAKVLELEKALRFEKAQVEMLESQLAKMKVPRSEKESVREMELG